MYEYYSTREDLPIRTDIDETKVISALQHKSKFNFELFWKKKKYIFLVSML